MPAPNGLLGLAERLVRVLERLADPRVLVTAMVVAGGYFYWTQSRVHDLKLDALLQWTSRKTAFDLLDCVRASETDAMDRVCEQAAKGEAIDLREIQRRRPARP